VSLVVMMMVVVVLPVCCVSQSVAQANQGVSE
jgi:hypothetical protein